MLCNRSRLTAIVFLIVVSGCSDSDTESEAFLIQYSSCSALEADLKQMLRSELEIAYEQRFDTRWGGGALEDNAVPGAPAPQSGAEGGQGGSREEGTDFSGTNNQEDGVDEADIVKTDGFRIFVLNGNRLHLFSVPQFGELVPRGSAEVEGLPRELLIDRDANRAVVFSMIWPHTLPEEHPLRELVGRDTEDGWGWRVNAISKISVFDISNEDQPALVRELFLEGQYQTARLTDGTVRVGTHALIDVPALRAPWRAGANDSRLNRLLAMKQVNDTPLAEIVPQVYVRSPSGEVADLPLSNRGCSGYYRPARSTARGMTSLYSFDLRAQELQFDADHIVSNRPTIYASQEFLYVAEPANDHWWFWRRPSEPERLNVHQFQASQRGRSRYMGSGRVKGVLHNQFALDEHRGYLRVATTTNFNNRWWLDERPEAENHVFVLGLAGRRLHVVGHVGGIAKNERIFAARMVGDKGYLVTFRQIDPLFTLDLSDPTNPRVIGELEIPGFSTYIHPIAGERLLTIGVGGDEFGANWEAQISMFDVSKFDEPSLMDVQELVADGEWGQSEALREHKAFQFWEPRGLLAVPVTGYGRVGPTWRYRSRLELISVEDGGLSSYGSIEHSHLFDREEDHYWDRVDVRRSIFMGDFIYALSDGGITVHTIDGLSPVTEQELPGRSPDQWYWWW